MALQAGPRDAACNRVVQLIGSGQDRPSATDRCLVCSRRAGWRIERPDGSYVVCDWCDSVIREYDARHPERDPSRHVRLACNDSCLGIGGPVC